jgi:acetoin utilization deacetylase AcuC-like enzyme
MVGKPARWRAMRLAFKKPKPKNGEIRKNNDTPSFSEVVTRRIKIFTSSSLSAVEEARTGRRAAEALAGPLTAFEAVR